jgi:hypothetical protein
MTDDKYYIKISPEVVEADLVMVPYTGSPTYHTVITGNTTGCCIITGHTHHTVYPTGTTGYYLSMEKVVSSGPNKTSLMTGLTIPILFTQSDYDIGYYSVFDGDLLQTDVVKNFIFSANTNTPNRYYFYNTSDAKFKNYLKLSTFKVDWGDGINTGQTITTLSPNYIYYDYISPGTYTITLTQNNPWGIDTVKKTVVVPYTGVTIQNPNGTAYFTPNTGSWSATPISYDYIFTGDSANTISAQTSDNYVSTPFTLTGYTSSRINELKLYGTVKYQLNTVVKDKTNSFFGVITSITPQYTGYTIQDVQYIDFSDGTSVYVLSSSGLTSNWMVQEPIVKDESLLNIVYQPEVQSDIFIERGKNSALERIERLGEVDNIGDLTKYGYGFFNFRKQEEL